MPKARTTKKKTDPVADVVNTIADNIDALQKSFPIVAERLGKADLRIRTLVALGVKTDLRIAGQAERETAKADRTAAKLTKKQAQLAKLQADVEALQSA